MPSDEPIEVPVECPTPDEQAAHDEQFAVLRRCFDALPPQERQVVALYYLAGMEQREIGDELALSQQVVSYRIKEALKRLRAGLTSAGFASAIPLLDGQGLGVALGAGHQAPLHVVAGALSKLSLVPTGGKGNVSARTTRRGMTGKWGAAPVVAAILGVAAVAGVLWMWEGEAPTARLREGLAPMTGTALQRGGSAAPSTGVKDEILVDEDFGGDQVCSFLANQVPGPKAGRILAAQKTGSLSVIAGGPDVQIDGRIPNTVAELRSRAVPVEGRPLLVLLPNRSLLHDGPYSVGIYIENQDGVVLYESLQTSEKSKSDTVITIRDAAGPLPKADGHGHYIGVAVDPQGRVAMVNTDGSLLEITRKQVPVEFLCLRIRASAGPGKGFVVWSFDKLRIVRLGSWPSSGRIEIPKGFHYVPGWWAENETATLPE